MPIDSALSVAAGLATGPALPARPADAAAWHQSWRRALEQAQWQARPAPRPATGAPATGARSDGGAAPWPAATALRPTPAAARAALAASTGGSTGAMPTQAAAPGRAWAGRAVATPLPHADLQPQASGQGPAAAAPLPRPGLLARPPLAAPTGHPPTLAPADPLLPQGAHASIDGSDVCIALRDASLDAAAASALRTRLQPLLRQQLRALGLALAELRINGHAGVPDLPLAPRSPRWP